MDRSNTVVSPVGEVRRWKVYPVPPVCSALWTPEDWDRTAEERQEQVVIEDRIMGRWVAVGRNADGVLVYSKATPCALVPYKPAPLACTLSLGRGR